MAQSAFQAINYTTSNENNRLVITAKAQVPLFNKIMIVGFLIWFVGYAWYKTASDPNLPFWLFPLVLLLGVIGGGIGLLITRGANKKIGTRQIIVDKNSKTFEATLDDVKVPFSDIKDITLTEKPGLIKTGSLLKLHLTNGEKTLLFPFTSFNQAQETLNQIKQNLR